MSELITEMISIGLESRISNPKIILENIKYLEEYFDNPQEPQKKAAILETAGILYLSSKKNFEQIYIPAYEALKKNINLGNSIEEQCSLIRTAGIYAQQCFKETLDEFMTNTLKEVNQSFKDHEGKK